MENQGNNSKRGGKIVLIIFSALIVAFILYYTIMLMSAPARKLYEIREKYGVQKTGGNTPAEKLLTDSTYLSLYKEKAFLQSRIAMAESDSIYLTLDIPDSVANLELSGVTVHQVKLREIKLSRILRASDNYAIISMLSSPLNIVRYYATIKKEPLMIKMAPKDTSEFKPDIIPDTTDREPVNYLLEMDNSMKIYFYQDTDTSKSDKKELFFFNSADRINSCLNSLKNVVRGKVPEYKPYIKVWLPKADAKILYRALPRKGQVAVCL
ncbi:MAG: hypothetical protein Q8868_07635 [Bacteroidota bacterium]|nr:hypothetical protein [Bacteroidota bacterium]